MTPRARRAPIPRCPHSAAVASSSGLAPSLPVGEVRRPRPDPLSLAALVDPERRSYATVAGVPVQIGLYAAPLGLVGYALFGGSRCAVFAAAGSVAAVSGSVVHGLSPENTHQAVAFTSALALATGAVFFVAGLARMGWISNFMSKAVIAGFITGMSIQIIVGQLAALVGVPKGHGDTFQKFWDVLSQISAWSLAATAIGLGSLALIFGLRRFAPRVPGELVAVVLTSVIVGVFDPDIGLVPKIPTGLPRPGVPSGISASDWLTLVLGGMVAALVGFSEGWGASEKIAETTHDDLDPNQEFRAYGVGEFGAGILGGMVTTASLSKSSVALVSGAKTQMCNLFLAVIVIAVLLVLAPAFQWLPSTALAAVVIAAMWGSANPVKVTRIYAIDRVDFALGLITAIVVLTWNLLPAMVTGIILSILYLIYRASFPARAELGRIEATGDYEAEQWESGGHKGGNPDALPVPGVLLYRFDAPLVFSNAESFKATARELLIQAGAKGDLPHTMIVDCEGVFYTDFTGAEALTSTHRYAGRYGVELSLARVHTSARSVLETAGTIDVLGEDHIFDTIRHAVEGATAKQHEPAVK